MRAVRSCGTQMWTSVSRSARAILPPPLPGQRDHGHVACACAASTAASTLAELPLVRSASSTSPALPSACTCLAKIASKS